jgi:hypothetical protein
MTHATPRFYLEIPLLREKLKKKIASGGVPYPLGGQWPRKRVHGYFS